MGDVIIPIDYEIRYPEKYESFGISYTEKDDGGNSKSHSTGKPHNGKSITNIKVSPDGNYFVTYSKEDCSIVGWKVGNEQGRLEPDSTVDIKPDKRVNQICVSDDKKLAYIHSYSDVNEKFIGK